METVPLKMLPYPVHAHRYAETKLPHTIEAHDDLGVAVAKAEAHAADPTVADILFVSVRRQVAVILKGNRWVFDDTLVGHFSHFEVREAQAEASERGIRAAIEALLGDLRVPGSDARPAPQRPAA